MRYLQRLYSTKNKHTRRDGAGYVLNKKIKFEISFHISNPIRPPPPSHILLSLSHCGVVNFLRRPRVNYKDRCGFSQFGSWITQLTTDAYIVFILFKLNLWSLYLFKCIPYLNDNYIAYIKIICTRLIRMNWCLNKFAQGIL